MRFSLLLVWVALIAGAFVMTVKGRLNQPFYSLVLIVVTMIVILLANWIIGSQRHSNPDSDRELKKQMAWAKFRGQYELTDTEWAILNLTDEFKQAHGYNPDGTLKRS